MLSVNNEKQDANRVYTDMYSDVKAEIITDIKIKSPVESGTLKIKFNLTPRVETNWIPLSHFRNMFPQFYQGELLLTKVLDPCLVRLESFNSGQYTAGLFFRSSIFIFNSVW